MNKKGKAQDTKEIEKQLEEQYVPFFQQSMGMPENYAQEIFKAIIKEQKEVAEREGTDKFPEKFGEVLLIQEKADPDVREAFGQKRAEGVTDNDILLWWNMHDLERRMVIKVDEMNRTILFEKLVQKDKVEEEKAAGIVAKHYPIYGDPDFQVFGTKEDRPLPFELKWRVNRYVNTQNQKDANKFQEELDAASSFNALLRKALEKGEL
jgi:hypothetical protein